MTQILIIAGAIIGLLLIIGFVYSILYKRASKGLAFVRTGLGGELVVLDSGALCLPIFHEIIHVNLNTLKIEVNRKGAQALITKDHLRVDVSVECHVRVKMNKEAISVAAQTLGSKTLDPNELRTILEPKIIDPLRAVASSMNIEELHEQRSQFVQSVLSNVKVDLEKNGLELESVSLTSLDQTSSEFFSDRNIFDAQGLTKLTKTIEEKRKERNEIEQTTSVSIAQRNLEANKQKLEIEREEEYARLAQERELNIRKAEQNTEIETKSAEQVRMAEEAKITAKQQIDLRNIESKRKIEQEEIEKEKAIQAARISQEQSIEIAEQEKRIAISQKSEAESEAQRKADEARVAAIKAQEEVETTRQIEVAKRDKAIEIIEAEKIAEKDAVGIKVQANAEKEAAEARAQAKLIEARASKDAVVLDAEAKQKSYEVEAQGIKSVSEAKNALSPEQINFEIKQLIIANLANIITASTEPMKNIDSIKIVQLAGQSPVVAGGAGAAGVVNAGGGSLPEQIVNSALAYRVNSQLLDGYMKDLGLDGSSLTGLTNAIANQETVTQPTEPVAQSVVEPAPVAEQIQDENAAAVEQNQEAEFPFHENQQ